MTFAPSTSASAWAEALLERVGSPAAVAAGHDSATVADWARSGAVAITGLPDRPMLPSGCGATAARGALLALDSIVGPLGLSGERLLAERAAISQWPAKAPWSLGGHCRAIRASDDHFALSLARGEDLDLVPALVCDAGSPEGPAPDRWAAVDRWAAAIPARDAVERCRLLGLPAGVIGDVQSRQLMRIDSQSAGGSARALGDLRVVDLSSLWAGPLCGHLLGLAGAKVLRVESSTRPDGGREGLPDFDDLIHGRQPSVAFDPNDLDLLHAIVDSADIVITSARPRGLESLGLDPQRFLAAREHGVWVQISAYGSTGPQANWVGFGDDTAMAAGIVRWIDETPIPVADALADPLTGMHAAVAAAAMTAQGGTHLIDIALASVAAACAGAEPDHDPYYSRGQWLIDTEYGTAPVERPTIRAARTRARALGEDTALVGSWFQL